MFSVRGQQTVGSAEVTTETVIRALAETEIPASEEETDTLTTILSETIEPETVDTCRERRWARIDSRRICRSRMAV